MTTSPPVTAPGEPTFAALKQAFGDHYLYAGLGTTFAVGPNPQPVAGAGPMFAQAMDEDDLMSYRALLAKSDEYTVLTQN